MTSNWFDKLEELEQKATNDVIEEGILLGGGRMSHTCNTCGCNRRDSKLFTWGWKDEENGEEGTYTHCSPCYYDLFPNADPVLFDELEEEI